MTLGLCGTLPILRMSLSEIDRNWGTDHLFLAHLPAVVTRMGAKHVTPLIHVGK